MLSKELIKDILFKEHHIVIGDDDPIITLLLTNDIIIKASQEAFINANEAISEKIEQISHDYKYDRDEDEKRLKQEIEEFAKKVIAKAENELSKQLNESLAYYLAEHKKLLSAMPINNTALPQKKDWLLSFLSSFIATSLVLVIFLLATK